MVFEKVVVAGQIGHAVQPTKPIGADHGSVTVGVPGQTCVFNPSVAPVLQRVVLVVVVAKLVHSHQSSDLGLALELHHALEGANNTIGAEQSDEIAHPVKKKVRSANRYPPFLIDSCVVAQKWIADSKTSRKKQNANNTRKATNEKKKQETNKKAKREKATA